MSIEPEPVTENKSHKEQPQKVFISIFVLVIAFVAISLFVIKKPAAPASVDRTNPDSVIRAYFVDWQNGNLSAQTSLMSQNYKTMILEPAESIQVLSIEPTGNKSATTKTYAVSFTIKVKGQGLSMHSGRYDWSYELTKDASGNQWLITNYGAG